MEKFLYFDYISLSIAFLSVCWSFIVILAWARYRVQIGQDELAVRGLLRGWQRWRWEDVRDPRVTLAFYLFPLNVLEIEAGGKRIWFHLNLLGSREHFDEIVEEVRLRSVW